MARNVIAAEHRRATRLLRASGRAAGRRLLDADDIARIEERIDAESLARRTYRALSGLPEHTRALLELVAVDGLSLTDAAGALGISRSPPGSGCTGPAGRYASRSRSPNPRSSDREGRSP
ncbi:sigma factor-like helix-turn-helix DNA-binding protein [Micromonospora sp. M12]